MKAGRTLGTASLLFLCASLLNAQQYTQISGQVLDPSGSAVPHAAVTVVSEDTGFRYPTRTQDNGVYLLSSLQPGRYQITVRKEGFWTVRRVGVKLAVGERTLVDFQLSVGSVEESITVNDVPSNINTTDASVGTLIGRDWIERLPINGRGLLGLLELTPGVLVTPATRGESGQFTANGQRPNTHYFTVDGLSLNNGVSGGSQPGESTGGSLPGMTAFGTFHQMVSLEALNEFRIQTSTLAPEFGRLPGAQTSLSSLSGSNQFHGSLYGYWRHEKLGANDWFANRGGFARAPSRVSQGGATLGGPLRRNRLFFFGSWESLRLRQPQVWRTAVPSLASRAAAPAWAQPLMSVYPAPTGSDLSGGVADWVGIGDRPARLNSGSLRLDAALTSRLTFFGRYISSPSSSEFGSMQINRLNMRTRTAAGGLAANLGAGFTQDFRFGVSDARGNTSWSLAHPERLPECYMSTLAETIGRTIMPCNSFVEISVAGLGPILSGPESTTRQRQWHFLDTVAVSKAGHEFRFGVDYWRLTPARSRPTKSISILADSLNELLGPSGVWVVTTPAEARHNLLKEFSAFFQDSWHPARRLALTFGLRWELNPPPVSFDSIPGLDNDGSAFDPPGQMAIWKLRYTNFAPRFGLAYRLRNDGQTVLRAGMGSFFDSSLAAATDIVNRTGFEMWEVSSGSTGTVKTILHSGFIPDLQLPRILQWNAALEHTIRGQVISASYVGSSGHGLLRREIRGSAGPSLIGNALTTNNADSEYHSLQLQSKVRMSRGLQGLASYTWSHSIDTGSSDSMLHWAGSGFTPAADRGSSDFDARHVFSLAITYDTGRRRSNSLTERLYRGWATDAIFRTRTGFPINVLNAERAMGVSFANIFRPNRVFGVPSWLEDPAAPGGRRLNPAAFAPTAGFSQGSLGRNALSGLGMSQLDLALRREISIRERSSLELRVEAFNLLNRANLADPVRFLDSPLFGEPASMLNLMLGSGTPASGMAPMLQIGGARSVQFGARLRF